MTLYVLFFFALDQPNITYISANMTVNQSESVNLTCRADGNPKSTVTWTKDSNIINSSFTVGGKSDEGLYVCTADNGIGTASSKSVFITVECKSKLTILTTNTVWIAVSPLVKQMETRLEFQFAIFWVPKALSVKARLSVNISFENEFNLHEKNKIILITKASTLSLFKNRGLGQPGNGLLTKNVRNSGWKKTITDLLNFYLVYLKGACAFPLLFWQLAIVYERQTKGKRPQRSKVNAMNLLQRSIFLEFVFTRSIWGLLELNSRRTQNFTIINKFTLNPWL